MFSCSIKALFGVICTLWVMDNSFVAQMRSWDVMRKYFGIERPGTVFVPLKFPSQLKYSEETVKKAVEAEKKRIQLN